MSLGYSMHPLEDRYFMRTKAAFKRLSRHERNVLKRNRNRAEHQRREWQRTVDSGEMSPECAQNFRETGHPFVSQAHLDECSAAIKKDMDDMVFELLTGTKKEIVK